MKPLILFDLDGTLADTAPDLVAAANQQRIKRGQATLPYEQLRPLASQGARGLLKGSLNLDPTDADYEATRLAFLHDYETSMTTRSQLFDGVESLLSQLNTYGIKWGIVTNKARYLAAPLVDYFQLSTHCITLVCGDSTPTPKPHPAPLLLAVNETGYNPNQCIYIGDDRRDIQAGRAAGMQTIAVSYGYSGTEDSIDEWQADAIAHHPLEILQHIISLQKITLS